MSKYWNNSFLFWFRVWPGIFLALSLLYGNPLTQCTHIQMSTDIPWKQSLNGFFLFYLFYLHCGPKTSFLNPTSTKPHHNVLGELHHWLKNVSQSRTSRWKKNALTIKIKTKYAGLQPHTLQADIAALSWMVQGSTEVMKWWTHSLTYHLPGTDQGMASEQASDSRNTHNRWDDGKTSLSNALALAASPPARSPVDKSIQMRGFLMADLG